MREHKQVSNERKLEEMILFFSKMCEMDELFGSIRLNKLLFDADFSSYLVFGKSISGVEYFALPQGPAPRIMKRVMTRMQTKGDLAIREKDSYGNLQKKPFALRQPDPNVFTVAESNLMYELLNQHWGKTGKRVSDESHEFLGWSASNLKETIPYAVSLVSEREPTLDEIGRGLELATMAKECLARNATRKTQAAHRRA